MRYLQCKRGWRGTVVAALCKLVFLLALMPVKGYAFSDQLEVWTGDFDAMLERRKIRMLVVYNELFYFLDGATQRGATVDAAQLFADYINEKYDLKTRKLNVIMIPVARDELLPALNQGIGDIAAANLTITPDRQELVDFSAPFASGVKEVVVTGPAAPELNSLADLSGQTIHVRESSSYFNSLQHINEQLRENDLEPVELVAADEYLEDNDLLEMVNAGLLPMAVVDNHKAQFWAGVFDNIEVREDLALTEGGAIAWAFRKQSPTLEKIINQFVAQTEKGTLHGNMILNRYLRDNKWVKNSMGEEDLAHYRETADFFRHYADEYAFDWLMLVALGFQESGLDQNVKSGAGAIGIMQVLPSTAKDPNVNISDIEIIENNIHAGTKYLRFLRDRYFSDPEIDDLNQTLLSFAAYNAGPAKISKLREEAEQSGLDPNVWFGNVEHIVARRVGRETVQYVSNIYKYYIAYSLLVERSGEREEAKSALSESLQ